MATVPEPLNSKTIVEGMADAEYTEKKRAAFCAVKAAMDMLVAVTEPNCGTSSSLTDMSKYTLALPKPPTQPSTKLSNTPSQPPPPTGTHPVNLLPPPTEPPVQQPKQIATTGSISTNSRGNASEIIPPPPPPRPNGEYNFTLNDDDEDSGNLGAGASKKPTFGMKRFTQSGTNIAASARSRLTTQASSPAMAQPPVQARSAAATQAGRAAAAKAVAADAIGSLNTTNGIEQLSKDIDEYNKQVADGKISSMTKKIRRDPLKKRVDKLLEELTDPNERDRAVQLLNSMKGGRRRTRYNKKK